MSECSCQQTGVIDWEAINRSIKSQESEIDWDRIKLPSAGVEVAFTTDDVDRIIATFAPAFRDGIRAGLRLQAQLAVEAAIRKMTGRLD